ncbi:MAG: nitrous oxide reductase family maturation protein NosD [Candidatus Nanoarchaeia archaeon]
MKKTSFVIMLTLLLMGTLALAFSIQQVKAGITIVPDDYPTIQEAINRASEGYTIYVRAGTYYENVVVDKKISLIGESREDTIIDGRNITNTILVTANDVVINGFTVTNSNNVYPNSGIFLDNVKNSRITGNNVSGNNGHGIFVMWGSGNSILDNLVTHNDQPGIRIDGLEAHALVAYNTIEFNQPDGIFLYIARDILIEKNFISNNKQCGITPQGGSQNITIRDNLIERNGWHGVFFYASNNSLVEANVLSENGFGGSPDWVLAGIDLHDYSNNNIIKENKILGNKYGVALVNSNNTAVYHNNLSNNVNQTWLDRANNTVWDDGYPSGGNYWNDYTGIDLYSGPYQNKTGEDGIGDTPYTIDVGNTDRYTLTKPYTPQRILVYTDKYSYLIGDQMQLGLHVINLEDPLKVCVKIWVELPGGSIYEVFHVHDVTLPAGVDYNNPSFRTFTLPNITPGIYAWHATLLNPATHETIVEDTAKWQFS